MELCPRIVFSLTEASKSGFDVGLSRWTRDVGADPLNDKDLRKYLFLAPWPSIIAV
jgi:hypothetical protein